MKETIQTKIRKVFRFLQRKETGHDKHGNNGYVVLSGKKYFVGCMNHNEWYLEPYYNNRADRVKFRTKRYHNTLFEKSDTIELLQLFEANGLLEVIIK